MLKKRVLLNSVVLMTLVLSLASAASILAAPPSAPRLQASPWWDSDWSYRKEISINHTKVTADLTDFPVLISLDSDADLASKAQGDGDDIAFTDESGSRLNHEIEYFDDSTGQLVAWVNVPSLSSSSDTILYVYYGNAAAANQENVEGVWDANYRMVQHLEETSGTHEDSTSNKNDGAPQGGVIQDATGRIDGADDFDGSDDLVECGAGDLEGWSNQDQGQQRAVIKDGKIYVVGGGDWGVTAFDAYIFVFDLETGALLQQSPSLGQYDFTASETAPVVDGDVVYACPTKSNMVAWDMSSNTIVWTTTGLSIWSNRIEFDGTHLYATTTDYKVVKVDSSDGTVVASYDLDPDTDYENAVPPYLDDTEGVVFAMGGSKLYKLLASDLSEIWNRDIGTGCLETGSGHSRMAPIVVSDSYTGNEPWVIFGCWGTDIFYAYDYDGNQEWSKAIPEGVRAVASYNPNNGYLYIPSMGDRIYVMNVTDGVEQFSITSVPDGSGFNRPCTISNDYLIFKTGSGAYYIYIYDANTGDYITRTNLGSNLFLTCFPIGASAGYLVTGGSVVNAGADDGGIFAVKAGDGQPVDYYPLYGLHKYGYVENALTSLYLQEDSLNPNDEITLEAWANLDALTTGSNDHLVCRASTYCLKFAQESAGYAPRFQLSDTTGSWSNLDLSSPLNSGEWHYLAGTWDGSTMRLYVNGAEQGTLSFGGTIDTTENPTFIGSYDGGSGQAPDGRIDEVRISGVARSAGWISTSFNNQSDPGAFYDVGPEETPSAPPPPLPSSFYGEIHIRDDPPTVGDTVEASVPGVSGAAATTTVQLSDSTLIYIVDVPGDVANTPDKEGGVEGDPITFTINGRVVAIGTWHSGTNVRLDFHPPQADPGGPYSGDEGAAINFTGSANDWGTDVTTYEWDWDNDSTYDETGQNPSHTWSDDGTYTVGLKVTDAQGGEGTATVQVTVNNVAPVLTLSGAASVDEGSLYTLNLSVVTDPGADTISACTVEWGDGNGEDCLAAIGGSLIHTYADGPDSPTISVDLTDEDGTYDDVDTLAVTVNDVPPTNVDAGGAYNGTAGQPVALSGSATCVAVDTCIYAWDLDDDGAYDDATGESTSYTWNTVGDYTIGLQVTDDDGNAVTDSADVHISGATHSIGLEVGWNLVSFNLVPVDTAIATVLSSIDGNYDLVYAWDGQNQQWLKYDDIPLSPDTLTNLDETMGFWIHMTVADTLDVVGSVPTTTDIGLYSSGGGWNLVGYPSVETRALPDALQDHGVGTDFSLVYAYRANDLADPWKRWDRAAPDWANDLTELSPGWGYWVRVSVDHTWSVDYLAP